MRTILALALTAFLIAASPAPAAAPAAPHPSGGTSPTTAPNAPPHPPLIVTDNPEQYATAFRDRMTVEGIKPLRDFYTSLTPEGRLPPQTEEALAVFENGIGSNRAIVTTTLDEVTVGDAFKSIYLYHYYGANAWVFTRLDFVRTSELQWTFSGLFFGSSWQLVALTTTPGAHSTH